MVCAECGAKNGHLMGCSRSSIQVRPTEPTLAERIAEDDAVETAPSAFEQYRLFAFPALYVVMWLLSDTGFGRFVLRTFFGMWLHELGHATAAWLTGRWALPVPWFTFSFGQNIVVSVAMFGGAAALIRFGRKRGSVTTMALGIVLALATMLGHLAPTSFQEPFFTFGGEAGAMIFGALSSCGFLVRSPLRLFQGGLRWGWLVIGTASWADATRVWWDSKTDFAVIPFGVEDGMPSDASRLVDEFGWDAQVMVRRFLVVALVSLVFALLAFVAALLRERFTRPRSASRPAS
ncbi:MAG: hypothetical protein Q8S33_35340 [Myxococcales bacterium]|nr:hypothetical protein [Myxococcales bacterium]